MLEKLARGVAIALRTGAAPLILGARLVGRMRDREASRESTAGRRLALASKTALDEIFFATELASATFVSLRDRRRVAQEIDDALALYEERGWLDDPSGFHPRPPPLENWVRDQASLPWFAYAHLRFESGYAPHAEEPGRDRWLGYAANRTAHAWILEHPGRPRPWLVCVPGYRMGHPMVDFTGFRARWLHRTLGLNVAIPVMPLHGPRRVGRRGGDGFLAGDLLDTIHAQSQAVWDVRRLISWLRDQGAPAIGAYGVSLGAYTTALVAGLEKSLDCVIAGIPTTDFVRLLRQHSPDFVWRAAARAGFSFERIERLLRVVSPLALPPRVPHHKRYMYAALRDSLASPEHARDLWHHWERPRAEWYHGSHVSFLWEAQVKSLLHEAFENSGLVARRAPNPGC